LHGYDRRQSVVRDGWFEMVAHHGRDGIDVVMLMNGRKAQYRFYEIELELARLARGSSPVANRPRPLPPGPVLLFTDNVGAVTLSSEDGTHRVRLTGSYEEEALWPEWSPHGDKVMFTRCRGDTCSVYVVRANGIDEHRISDGIGILWLD